MIAVSRGMRSFGIVLLKRIVANQASFVDRLLQAGYSSLTVAIEDTKQIIEERRREEQMSGPLQFSALYETFKHQIGQRHQVQIAFADLPGATKASKLLNLGRLRALARSAALAQGYSLPSLNNGGRWEMFYQDSMSYDNNGTIYGAHAIKRTEPFWSLSSQDKRELMTLAKRRLAG